MLNSNMDRLKVVTGSRSYRLILSSGALLSNNQKKKRNAKNKPDSDRFSCLLVEIFCSDYFLSLYFFF